MKKNKYVKPDIEITLLHADRILAAVSKTAGNTDDIPGYGGEGDGEDLAKKNNAWSSWDED